MDGNLDKTIYHYGVLRRSGRYPWGSGGEMLATIDRLKSAGLSEVDISKALGIKTTDLRLQKSLAVMHRKEEQIVQIRRLKDTGMSNEAIGDEVGLPYSTVRDYLKPYANAKYKIILTIAGVLKNAIEKYNFIDIGDGVEHHLGITSTKLKQAVALLMNEGYTKHYIRQEQLGTGKKTSVMVLSKPGMEYKEVYANRDKIHIPNVKSLDRGHSFTLTDGPVNNISIDRIAIADKEHGGAEKDGLIEIRRGVKDLDLGAANYAQVRIAVDGTHYIKGVAVYGDKMPPGKDIVFYTSKADTGDPKKLLKPQEPDPENPFGTFIYSKFYEEGGEKIRSGLNIVYEEGDWSDWSKTLSSQFLSKQYPELAKRQLGIDLQRRVTDFEEIMSLDNPTLKEHLLRSFADECDSAAVVLKAAAMPKQTNNVLIPITSMKENQVYAPFYPDGTSVVLIRHPHGGVFEIPRLTVNNKNPEAKRILGNSNDAIGINPKVASILSGADFDGDTVIAFPDNRKEVLTSKPLDALKDFDPRTTYAYSAEINKKIDSLVEQNYTPAQISRKLGINLISKAAKQRKMGEVSNLITDMTIQGATESEIARAVRHSMVVIDAEKHRLNHVQSARDNGILALTKKYQTGGASTLISRAKSQERVPYRKDVYAIDPETGKKVFIYTGETVINKKGETVERQTVSTKMYEADDAMKLSSGTVIEKIYADYANNLKSLGDRSRLESTRLKAIPYSREAKRVYAKEVESLNSKLRLAESHQPLERKAQALAAEMVRKQKETRPGLSKSDVRTIKGKALVLARDRVGSKKNTIEISPREWEAIQMGAISGTKLKGILRNADQNQVKELATPRSIRPVSTETKTRANLLLDAGYTTAQVARVLGLSPNQVANIRTKKE